MRIQRLQREGAVIVQLRRHGYTMNSIGAFLGRSTSFVFRVLNFQRCLGVTVGDLRKIPCRTRQLAKARMERNIQRFGEMWNLWLTSKDGKPP